MPCPVCSHTMHNLGVQDQRIWWCPRCGCVKSESPNGHVNISRPALVNLIRDAYSIMQISPGFYSSNHETTLVPSWHWEAILEAVELKPGS